MMGFGPMVEGSCIAKGSRQLAFRITKRDSQADVRPRHTINGGVESTYALGPLSSSLPFHNVFPQTLLRICYFGICNYIIIKSSEGT